LPTVRPLFTPYDVENAHFIPVDGVRFKERGHVIAAVLSPKRHVCEAVKESAGYSGERLKRLDLYDKTGSSDSLL
jgi:hypothetical protein